MKYWKPKKFEVSIKEKDLNTGKITPVKTIYLQVLQKIDNDPLANLMQKKVDETLIIKKGSLKEKKF